MAAAWAWGGNTPGERGRTQTVSDGGGAPPPVPGGAPPPTAAAPPSAASESISAAPSVTCSHTFTARAPRGAGVAAEPRSDGAAVA